MENIQDKKNKEFMKRLNYAIETANINASQLAKKMGRSRGLISNYKNGNKNMPNKEIVKEFAQALNVSPQWLNLETDEMVDIAKVKQFEKGKEIITEMVKIPIYTIQSSNKKNNNTFEIIKIDEAYLSKKLLIDYCKFKTEDLKELFFITSIDVDTVPLSYSAKLLSKMLLLTTKVNNNKHLIWYENTLFSCLGSPIGNNGVFLTSFEDYENKNENKKKIIKDLPEEFLSFANFFGLHSSIFYSKLSDYKKNALNIPSKDKHILNKNNMTFIGAILFDFRVDYNPWGF